MHLTVWDGFNFGVGLMLVMICAKAANAIFVGIMLRRARKAAREAGFRPTTQALHEVLKEMEREGIVVEEDGKWRLKTPGKE